MTRKATKKTTTNASFPLRGVIDKTAIEKSAAAPMMAAVFRRSLGVAAQGLRGAGAVVFSTVDISDHSFRYEQQLSSLAN